MLVIDWRKQVYVIFNCSTVSPVTHLAIALALVQFLNQRTQVAFVPRHIIFTTATAQQPDDQLILIYTMASIGSRWHLLSQLLSSEHPSVRDFDDLDLNTPTSAAVVERLEHVSVFRDAVQSRVSTRNLNAKMTLHPNPIRDNAYKLTLYVLDGLWANKSSFVDTFRQKLGRQPRGPKAVLFTYRLIVGSPPDYGLSWARVSVLPAVPNLTSSILYAGYVVVYDGYSGRATQVNDAHLPRR